MTEEWFYIIIIIFALFFLSTFFLYEMGTRGAEVTETVEKRILNEAGSDVVLSLFSNKLPFVEKGYVECAIDAVLQNRFAEKKDKVLYGAGVGELNLTEIIPPLLDKYFGDRWELTLETSEGSYSYGREISEKDAIFLYAFSVPIPEKRVGTLMLKIGNPQKSSD